MVNPYRVFLKALGLFLAANLIFAVWGAPHLGQLTAYNKLFPGRARLPFGESPREAYNFSLFDLDAMFASHEISATKPDGEFRVVVIGDSSVWGTLLRPEESLVGQLNALATHENPAVGDGLQVRYYNLGYPTLSLTKDLIILDRARQYEPDLVVWLTTLESFPREKQLAVPLVEKNPAQAVDVITRYRLGLDNSRIQHPDLWQRTIVGRRKDLADLLRLQLYGILWTATGIDQTYPADYPRAQVDLEADPLFHGKTSISKGDLLFEALANAKEALGEVPLLVVNEPILISAGLNSDIRYNYYYPREVYDHYRAWLGEEAGKSRYEYLDVWDLAPEEEFTNSAIHLNRNGTARLAERVSEMVLSHVR